MRRATDALKQARRDRRRRAGCRARFVASTVGLASDGGDSVLTSYLNNLSALFSVCSTPHMSGRPTSAQASISFIA